MGVGRNLTFNGSMCNVGGGLDVDSGIFTVPVGGMYLFMFHIATHDNKKALLSIRKNGDEIVLYAYTGTWLADFPMNHYTHWVGMLLKPNEEEANLLRKAVEEGTDPSAPATQVENGLE